MNKKAIFKWVNIAAFGLLLIGGLNFLLMGLFEFDLFAAIFGGNDAIVSRIFYSIFGVSAVILLAFILWRAFMTGNKKPAAKSAAKPAAAGGTTSK